MLFKNQVFLKKFSQFLILNNVQKFYSTKETMLCKNNDLISFNVISYKENNYLNIVWRILKNDELITNFTLKDKSTLIIQMRYFGAKINKIYPSFSFLLPSAFKTKNRVYALKVKWDLFVNLGIKTFSYLELDDLDSIVFENNNLKMEMQSSFEIFAWNSCELKGYLKQKKKTINLKKIYQLGRKVPNHQTLKIVIKEKDE